eukprot:s512_g2.t1
MYKSDVSVPKIYGYLKVSLGQSGSWIQVADVFQMQCFSEVLGSKGCQQESQEGKQVSTSADQFCNAVCHLHSSCKWCKEHSNSAGQPDFWPFEHM